MTRERLEELLTEGLRDSELVAYVRELQAELERLRAAVESAWTMTEAAQMNGERPGWVDAEELRHVLSGATDV